MKSASQSPGKLDERDGQRRAAEHEAQHVHARRLAGELVADELSSSWIALRLPRT
jgi:hypothetical protein